MFLDDVNVFLDDLNVFLDDLNTNPITDEWYMSNFADKHIKILESYEAFDILKQFVDYMIEEYDEKIRIWNHGNIETIKISSRYQRKILYKYTETENCRII